jgi:hypothetical protein
MRTYIVLFITLTVALFGVSQTLPGAAQGPDSQTPLQVQVTGDPAPAYLLQLAILTTIRVALGLPSDDQVVLNITAPELTPLDATAQEAVEALVTVTPPGGEPVSQTVPVMLVNTVLPRSDAQALLVSNSPERLPFGKVLYVGQLRTQDTVRLLYHHQNGSTNKHMFLTVTVSNPSEDVVTAWISGATGGSGLDELALGHLAAWRFLDQYWGHAGFLLQIPGNTTIPLFVQDIAPLGITSGLMQIELLNGDRLNLQVTARLDGEMDPPGESFPSDFDTQHQRGLFRRPLIAKDLTYIVGGPPLMMTVGGDADSVHDGDTNAALQGNYGVIYAFQVDVQNPSPLPTAPVLSMHAQGGAARGTFLIDGHIMESPPLLPNAPQTIATIPLAPETNHLLRIETMPESGSSYPVQLILESQ